jgi:hypothetical protein
MRRAQFTPEHDLFRESVHTFVQREMTPFHLDWNRDGIVTHIVISTLGRKASANSLSSYWSR